MSLHDLIHDPWEINWQGNGPTLTVGHFATEIESADHFDALAERAGFTIRHEVTGMYQAVRPHQIAAAPRIDRIIIPSSELCEAGWTIGPVGVELKRSGEKVGPVISQALDYSRALWSSASGLWYSLPWVFIWPMPTQYGAVGSICSQQRIGGITSNMRGELVITSGQHRLARWDGAWTVNTDTFKHGRKVGSR